jgi:hypothetical protein
MHELFPVIRLSSIAFWQLEPVLGEVGGLGNNGCFYGSTLVMKIIFSL